MDRVCVCNFKILKFSSSFGGVFLLCWFSVELTVDEPRLCWFDHCLLLHRFLCTLMLTCANIMQSQPQSTMGNCLDSQLVSQLFASEVD